jgi:hypothetical protein
VAAALHDHEDSSVRLWEVLSRELGLCGIGTAEEFGGLGGGGGEMYAVLEMLGHSPAWTPFLGSVVLGGGALRLGGGALAGRILPSLVRGETTVALAYLEAGRRNAIEPVVTTATVAGSGWRIAGAKVGALGLDHADFVVFSALERGGQVTLFCVETDHPGLTLTPYATVDGAAAADVVFHDLELTAAHVVGTPGEGLPLLGRLVDEGTAAACATACGAMRALIERTVDYCRQRRQFGKALADFQVLQHRLVDMHVATEQAISLTQLAFAKLAAPAPERREAVSGAKYLVAEACRAVAQGAVQLHGGIGTTEELVIGRYFKRLLMLEHLFGGGAYHLDRYRHARTESEVPP